MAKRDYADVFTILRVLADGGHLCVICPTNRARRCTLHSWKGRTPGPSWKVSMRQMEKLDAAGVLSYTSCGRNKDGTVLNFYHLLGRNEQTD